MASENGTHSRTNSSLQRSNVRVARIAGALGAELSDIDLASDLSDKTVAEIHRALMDHQVIFFRDQTLSPRQHLAFANHFGEPVRYPMIDGIDGFPEISPVRKRPHERMNFGGVWHSDSTYLDAPPMGTILVARALPPTGGDTEFANMYLAYETLSEGLRTLLDGLDVVQSSIKANAVRAQDDQPDSQETEIAKQGLETIHPAVVKHPETCRKALYVNAAHSVRFDGWSEDESAPILDYLFAHLRRPEFTCRFAWSAGSVAFWDNRCTQHNPINDYHGHARLMHRITIAGTKPRR